RLDGRRSGSRLFPWCSGLMVANAVDDASAFEVDREIAVVPAADGRLADRGVFFVGQAETLQHGALAIASRRQCKGAVTLLADGDFDSLSASAQREEEAGQQQAGARHASVSGGGRGTFTGLASLLGLFLQDVPCQQLALGVGGRFELGADFELAILAG